MAISTEQNNFPDRPREAVWNIQPPTTMSFLARNAVRGAIRTRARGFASEVPTQTKNAYIAHMEAVEHHAAGAFIITLVPGGFLTTEIRNY